MTGRPARAKSPVRLLVIDNYDSFTFNLVQYLGELGAQVDVVRKDVKTVDELLERDPAEVVISPGPGEPKAAGNTPAATPTAEPLLEPPGVWSAFHGLRVGEGSPHANCVVTVLPMMIAPAFFSSATEVASYSGTKSSNMGEQQVVLMPWV